MSDATSSKVINKKPERLINLTLALLAAKRYITKDEIFDSVAGYEGRRDAQERMFERDKDDLRSLGIEIEVGNLDPFFEDEPGYRIRSDSYALSISDLTSEEVALLSLAASLWHESVLSDASHNALRKLKSLGIPADFSAIGALQPKFEEPQAFFDAILIAIENRQALVFEYSSSQRKRRTVHPYTLTLWNGSWYLVAFDCDRKDLRTFKISRFLSQPSPEGKKKSFEIPPDFHVKRSLMSDESSDVTLAQVRIRKGHALTLRESGTLVSDEGEFDLYEFKVESVDSFVRELLWHSDHVVAISPEIVRERAIRLLKERAHG